MRLHDSQPQSHEQLPGEKGASEDRKVSRGYFITAWNLAETLGLPTLSSQGWPRLGLLSRVLGNGFEVLVGAPHREPSPDS